MSPYETSFALIREKLRFSRLEFHSRLDWLSTHILNPRNLTIAGGDEEDRTPDPLRARQVLSQLSYTPIIRVSDMPLSLMKIHFAMGLQNRTTL